MTADSGKTLSCLLLVSLLAAAHAAAGQGNLPQAEDANPDPHILEITLVAREARLDLDGDGLQADVYTFNGRIPGPEIRARVGDTVIVHFINELPEDSSIHWHGVEVNNASDGTPVTQNEVRPGESYTYRFQVTRAGVFWYHPHFRPGNQVFKGLFGSFIVTDDHEETLQDLGILPDAAHTKTLVLSDTTVCKEEGENDTSTFPGDPGLPWAGSANGSFPGHPFGPSPRTLCENPRGLDGFLLGTGALPAGTIPNVIPPHNCPGATGLCRTNEGQVVLANGRAVAGRSGSPFSPGDLERGAKPLNVPAARGLRLQIINASIKRYYRLRMTDASGNDVPLHRVGGEGGLLDRVRLEGGMQQSLDTNYDRGEILIAPGDRADVVVVMPEGRTGDILTLWTRDYVHVGFRFGGYAFTPTVPVLHVRIAGGGSKKRFHIEENTDLLADARIDAAIEDLELLPTVELIDSADLPLPGYGSDSETILLTTQTVIGFQSPSIDGRPGHFDPSVADFTQLPPLINSRYAHVGDLLEFEVTNMTDAHHPFHQHGFSFQPVELRGAFGSYHYDYNEFVDNVNIPAHHTLVYRIRLADRPRMDGVTPGGAEGRWVFHCHVFHHAAQGMISELVVLPSP